MSTPIDTDEIRARRRMHRRWRKLARAIDNAPNVSSLRSWLALFPGIPWIAPTLEIEKPAKPTSGEAG